MLFDCDVACLLSLLLQANLRKYMTFEVDLFNIGILRMCGSFSCLNRVLCKVLCSMCLFCGSSESVQASRLRRRVLMLMVVVCCCGQDGASNNEGKFGMPGYYELAGEWEDVWTFEDGNNGTIWSFIDMETDKYPSNEEFHYLLVADEGQNVELVFEEPFDIEYAPDCKYDYLMVRDGRYGYSPLLGRLCGQDKPETLVSSGRYMWLIFVTDEDVNGLGYVANYTFIDAPIDKRNKSLAEECHFNLGGQEKPLSGYDGYIESETARLFFRSKEKNKAIDCVWEIEMPGWHKIMIEFVGRFTMADVNECSMNRVEIYDLHTYDAPRRLLKKYCSTAAPTVMAQSNRVFIRFVASNTSSGNHFQVLYTAFRDASSGVCNETISFACGEQMCLDYSLQCNGRKNCFNFGYDELNCKTENPEGLLDGKVDSVLGVTMGIILLVTLITIVMTCRHSCLRTREKAKAMAQRRKAEKQAVTYMMDNKEGADNHEMTTLGERYNTQYIKLSSEPHSFGYGQRPSLTPTNSSAPMGMRGPLTEYEKIMDGDAVYRDGRAGGPAAGPSSPWVYRDSLSQTGHQFRPMNDVQIHV